MNVLVCVISPAAIWVMPRHFVGQLQRDFPQHTFLEAWDRGTLRRLLPDADVAFTPFVDPDVLPSATRLRWVQSPAVGVGNLMFPELLASPVIITSARGIRARSISEHVIGVTIALARQLPLAFRAQTTHQWAQDQLEGSHTAVRTLQGQRMGIVGLGAVGLPCPSDFVSPPSAAGPINRFRTPLSGLTPSGRLTACSSYLGKATSWFLQLPTRPRPSGSSAAAKSRR
jgi:hypothetical protein